MNYFKYFPITAYGFGNETLPDLFRNIAIYVDVVDQIKQNSAFYSDYFIQEFERPDQVSYKLYGTTNYYWTFWLMNDKIKERGWPLTNRALDQKIKNTYKNKVITTRTALTDKFKINQSVTGNTSGASGIIDHRHLDLGQLVLRNTIGSFTANETVSSTNSNGDVETIIVSSFENEYNSAHHYENANKEYVDIDPAVGPGSLLTEITYEDRFINFNEELKQIRVIKPQNITEIVNAYREALRS